jgi:hypothetical protein
MIRGVIESFVDLTYRGLSLGRRIRLSQVRPSTGYLELPAPMPVGSQIAVVTDDGTAFDAVVTAIHEQVAGSDRTPGMTVAPALAAEAAGAWWAARVSLPEDDALRPRAVTAAARSRPATVRPRSHTDPMPPSLGGRTTDEVPAILSDLDARVAAAAGVAPARPDGDRSEMRTMVMPLAELEALTAAAGGEADPAIMQQTGEHAVIDDGKRTMIMELDPATLGIDLGAAAVAASAGAPPAAADRDAPAPDAGDAGDDADAGPDADGEDDEPPDTLKDTQTSQPMGGRRKRRSRR